MVQRRHPFSGRLMERASTIADLLRVDFRGARLPLNEARKNPNSWQQSGFWALEHHFRSIIDAGRPGGLDEDGASSIFHDRVGGVLFPVARSRERAMLVLQSFQGRCAEAW